MIRELLAYLCLDLARLFLWLLQLLKYGMYVKYTHDLAKEYLELRAREDCQ